MNELLAVGAITILAVISPGPDFAMVTRSSYVFGRRLGLLSALGIAFGVQVHVLYTVLGVSVVITHSPVLFLLMKVAGAIYLIYLGFKSFTNKSRLSLKPGTLRELSASGAFRTGFLTNALNPKTMLFVVSSYAQVVKAGSSLSTDFAYGFFMSFSHWAWFSLVAVFFSSESLRCTMLDKQHAIDKIIGSALIVLGMSLAFVSVGR